MRKQSINTTWFYQLRLENEIVTVISKLLFSEIIEIFNIKDPVDLNIIGYITNDCTGKTINLK